MFLQVFIVNKHFGKMSDLNETLLFGKGGFLVELVQ